MHLVHALTGKDFILNLALLGKISHGKQVSVALNLLSTMPNIGNSTVWLPELLTRW